MMAIASCDIDIRTRPEAFFRHSAASGPIIFNPIRGPLNQTPTSGVLCARKNLEIFHHPLKTTECKIPNREYLMVEWVSARTTG